MTSTRRISERGKLKKGKNKKRIGKSEVDTSCNESYSTLDSKIDLL